MCVPGRPGRKEAKGKKKKREVPNSSSSFWSFHFLNSDGLSTILGITGTSFLRISYAAPSCVLEETSVGPQRQRHNTMLCCFTKKKLRDFFYQWGPLRRNRGGHAYYIKSRNRYMMMTSGDIDAPKNHDETGANLKCSPGAIHFHFFLLFIFVQE